MKGPPDAAALAALLADAKRHAPTAAAIEAYEARKRTLMQAAEELDRKERSLSTARGLTFLAALGLGIAAFVQRSYAAGIGAGALAAVFIAAVVAHAIVITRRAELDQRLGLVDRGLLRIADQISALPDPGERFAPATHPYASDLDIFGASSLFQLLSAAETSSGQATLASWLLSPADPKTIAERQAAVRELRDLRELREDLAVLAQSARAKMSPEVLTVWAEAKRTLFDDPAKRFALLGRFIAPLTVTLAIASSIFAEKMGPFRYAWLGAMALQIVFLSRTGSAAARVLAAASSREEPLGRYAPLFARIEAMELQSPLLRDVHAAFAPPKDAAGTHVSASAAMASLQRIIGFAELRHAGVVHILVHLFTLWDVWCAVALERWRVTHGPRIRVWLEALGTLEALASLAGFAHDHPDYAFAEIVDGAPRFVAEDLGHPLLARPRRVANDVALGLGTRDPQALMITGSNMSGKSTLLRAIGMNAVLALAGAPVCARTLVIAPLDVRTSMRISDSLEKGMSHFYAELTRLKEVVDAADSGRVVLFLLDEILHGTNSRERQIGAKDVVKHLLTKQAIGAVSSHDLGLATLESETKGVVRNTHFEEHVEQGQMVFDYLLKPGVVTTTNALRLMRVVGLPIAEHGEDGTADKAPTERT